MKGLKKLLTGILAGAMAFTLALSAGNAVQVQAAEETKDGSITISNTTANETYSLYKVFDATYSGKNIAYSYKPTGQNDAFLAALTSENSPFTVTSYGEAYNVVRKDTADDATVLAFIKANGPTRDDQTKAWSGGNYKFIETKTGNGESITFTGLGYGYYFITSSLGSVVSIDSAVKKAVVIDKNQKTTLDKQEAIDNGETVAPEWKYVGAGTVEKTVPTQFVGSKVKYQLVGNLTQYSGDKKIKWYQFDDEMDEGLTPNKDVVVKVGTEIVYGPDVKNSNIAVTYDGQKTTIKINTVTGEGENEEFIYSDSTTPYLITYSATINEKALEDFDPESN